MPVSQRHPRTRGVPARTRHVLWLALFPFAAQAAEVTDFLNAKELGVTLGYEGSSLRGGLEESGVRFSERAVSRHDVTLCSEYAPGQGFLLHVRAELTPHWKMAFPGAPDIIFDPTTGGGTFLVGDASPQEPTHYGSGMKGLWLGAAVQPPSSPPVDRLQSPQWRLGLAVRTPSPQNNLWIEKDGKRGASMGSPALNLSAAISSMRGASDPYMTVAYQREFAAEFDLPNPNEDGGPTTVALHPPSTLTATAGLELLLNHDASTQARGALDIRVEAGYRSWGDMASGTYLPSVLPSSVTVPSTLEETVFGRAGVGFRVRTAGGVRVASRMHAEWGPPYRLEHLYNVRTTADTYRLLWTLTLGQDISVRGQD